ncbi:ABC transporter substrate-binding protein [Streptococcus thermophilus CNCM I-1630]|nr:ABC transporter substrate-binding protein [Streptococcus thermophilus CNCM I-1630]
MTLLQTAGLLKLDVKDGELATIKNISENPKKLEITGKSLLNQGCPNSFHPVRPQPMMDKTTHYSQKTKC